MQATGEDMTGTGLPLDGVRVVEMTHMVMGPTCGMILAQLGAEVIKVEPPSGDKTRSLGGMGTSFFPLFNRGKRSIVLDFEKPADRETMQRLLAGADIRIGLFENCLFLVAQHMVEYEMTGNKPRSMPEREHAWPIYDIFDTAGGGRIFIGVVTEGHWQSFCKEFGLREFADDPGLRTTTDRILARARIIPRVTEEIKRWNVAELSAKLDSLNICFSPINRPEDLLSDPHVLRPGGLVVNINAAATPFRAPALPIEWNGGHIGEGLKVPVLGADTPAVRAELQDATSTANTDRRRA